MTFEKTERVEQGAYGWDNAWQRARRRLTHLESVFDQGSVRLLEARGIAEGWHCLDIGAGGGSIALWLCQQVGPAGHVVATDIDTRFLERLDASNLEVRRHDIVSEALPEGAFDLVHTRLLLEHLPGREQALHHMVTALKPGGWLVVEEIDYVSAALDPYLDADTAALFLKVRSAFVHMWAARGWDPEYGRRVYGALRRQGLVDVEAEGRLFMWPGGSPGSQWMQLTYEQGREAIVASGALTEAEVDTVLRLWSNPDFASMSQLCMAAWGRRPTT